MAQVWNALNSLSQTVGRRGGISDAMLRSADASIGLKRAEYDIARGQEADKMALEKHNAIMPGLKRQAAEDEAGMEMVSIDASSFFPKDAPGMIHVLTPRGKEGESLTKDGKSIFDDFNSGLPGSSWNEAGRRINKDGTEVKIPRWQLEKQYLPAMQAIYLSRMDPIKKLNDKLYETEQALQQGADPNSPDSLAMKEKSDLIKKTLSDPNQLASMYAKKTSLLHDQIALGIANNARPDYINIMKSEADKSEANYQKYSVKMTPEQRQVFDADLAAKKADTESKLAHANYYKAAAGKAGRTGTGKAPSFTERKYAGAQALQRFAMENGLEIDPDTKQISSGGLTPEEKASLEAAAKQRGIDIFFGEQEIDDEATGSDWIPFNDKKVKQFSVRGAMPREDYGTERRESTSTRAGKPAPASQGGDDFNSLLERGKVVSGKTATKPQANATQPMSIGGSKKPQAPAMPENLPASLSDLDNMVKKLPEEMDGIYKKSPSWERGRNISEGVASITGRSQTTQKPAMLRKGEDNLTKAIRIATGKTDIYDLNIIADKLQTIYKGKLSDAQLANLINEGKILGNKTGA